jgi:hypothetical protein
VSTDNIEYSGLVCALVLAGNEEAVDVRLKPVFQAGEGSEVEL